MTRLLLDAGALIGVERNDARVLEALETAYRRDADVITISPVLAQVWRNGTRQARLARMLRGVDVVAPDQRAAQACGELLAKTSTTDVVDGLLVVLSRNGDVVATSDPDDLATLAAAAGRRVAILAV